MEWAMSDWIEHNGLQWGRDRAVAEMSPSEARCQVRPGFNGAATARSRKLRCVQTDNTDFVSLQWGRDRAVAEIVLYQDGRAV